MDRRGRSRDVSPLARARTPLQLSSSPRPSPMYQPSPPPVRQSVIRICASSLSPKPPLPHARDPASNHLQSLASSSRPSPLPSPLQPTSSLSTSPADTLPRTQSSSSILSDASEHTPLTPPDAGQDQYALDRPLDYYESPPSPPRSLQDRMHVAYALDDMHLAKVLLLKLKGIEVSGDDDPRIDAVRDEDFSSSFVPEGGLRLDADAEARIQEAERRAREVQKRREREERLRQCERVWESSLRRFRGERERINRAKDEAYRLRREAERREKERDRERIRKAEAARAARGTQPLRIARGPSRQLLSYDSLRHADARFPKPPCAKDQDDSGLFLYEIMPSPPSPPLSVSPPTSRLPTDEDSLTLPRAQRELAAKHAKSLSRSIAFSDVLTAMHGTLFPEDEHARPYVRCKPHQAALLASLLEPVEKVEEKSKALQLHVPARKRERVKNPAAARLARSSTLDSVSSTSSTTTCSESTATRSGSWFSFASKSSFLSSSTAITTPSSSPITPTKPSIILSSPLSSSPPSDSPLHSRRQSSRPPVIPTVPAAEHPLALPTPPTPKHKEPLRLAISRGRALTRRVDMENMSDDQSPPLSPSSLVHRVSRSVSTIIDFAAQFQRAYVKATMYSAGVDLYSRSMSRSTSRSPSRSPVRVRCTSSSHYRSRNGLKPEGYRVSSTDVQVFIAIDPSATDEALQYQRTLIPLCIPSSDSLHAHERIFPLPPPLPRSPFRPQVQPNTRLSRVRPVANPVMMRLHALHNVCQVNALNWVRARDGSLAAGKEKMVGIAWEGIGRSSLGWEVSAVH